MKTRIGIIGGAGYTAGELIRILVTHPDVEISFVQSESNAGNAVTSVHGGLVGDTDLSFCEKADLSACDLLFMCGGHGKSSEFWAQNNAPEGLKIIDLAQDFRDESNGYIYGLPEWQRARIEASGKTKSAGEASPAVKIANPGCFATAIQLALLPLAAEHLLKAPVSVTAITGSTGAGVKPGATTHFSWRDSNLSAYKIFEHQHLTEICRNLGLISGSTTEIDFIPIRGDFTRGIFAALHTPCELNDRQAQELYKDYYKDAAFTFVADCPIDLKQVVNTNKCLVKPEIHNGKIVVTSVIDNLLKGASGQAVQNMNLVLGIPEKTGLILKASAF